MDKTKSKPSADQPAVKPPQRHQFMDVFRKPKPDQKPAQQPAKTEPAPAAAEPAKPNPSAQEAEFSAEEKPVSAPPDEAKSEEPQKPAPKPQISSSKPANRPMSSQRKSGVGLAIFATIIIALGLGLLATYAYLRSNNISVF